MRISKTGEQLLHPYPVNLLIKLPFSDLLFMHGYTLRNEPRKDPIQHEVAIDMVNVSIKNLKKLREWCDSNLRSGPGNKKKSKRKELLDVELPEDPDLWAFSGSRHGCKTLGELSKNGAWM